MNPRVTKVSAAEGFVLSLEFSNGELREFDVKPFLDKGIFVQLQDEAYFKRAKVSMGTVEWPDGQDFCPDTLYEMSQAVIHLQAQQRRV